MLQFQSARMKNDWFEAEYVCVTAYYSLLVVHVVWQVIMLFGWTAILISCLSLKAGYMSGYFFQNPIKLLFHNFNANTTNSPCQVAFAF